MFKDDHMNRMIVDYLEQVYYWLKRFEFSKDINHLDNAERHAQVVILYLPVPFKKLNSIGIENLFKNLSCKDGSRENKKGSL